MTVGKFNSPHLTVDRLPRQKINKEILGLSRTVGHMDITDIQSTCCI